jgi:hypothetical protein
MSDIVSGQPEVEEYDLPDAAAESDLSVGERLLAGLLVRAWLAKQSECPEGLRGLGAQDVSL